MSSEKLLKLISDEDNLSTFKTNLSELSSRLEQGHFNLAVLGQFKRGKSTLLNSLIGYQILPSSVIPLTAIPTFIYYYKLFTFKYKTQIKKIFTDYS
jgi:GTPase SAR1 family protein